MFIAASLSKNEKNVVNLEKDHEEQSKNMCNR